MTCKVMQPWKNSNDLFSKLYPDTPFVYECHENPASNTTFPSSSLMGSRVDDRLISLSLTSCVGVFENFPFIFFGNSLRHFPTKGKEKTGRRKNFFLFFFLGEMLFALSRMRKRGDEIIRWEIAPRILLLPSINL